MADKKTIGKVISREKTERKTAIMFKKVVDRFRSKEKTAHVRRDRATQLMEYLQANNSLVLDREGLALVGMSRKQAFQTVYDLVVNESIQMRAESDGKVIIMTNAEYIRQKEDKARETWAKEAGLKMAGDAKDSDLLLNVDEDNPDIMYAEGKSLPERERDPWISFDDAFFDRD